MNRARTITLSPMQAARCNDNGREAVRKLQREDRMLGALYRRRASKGLFYLRTYLPYIAYLRIRTPRTNTKHQMLTKSTTPLVPYCFVFLLSSFLVLLHILIIVDLQY